MLHAAIAELRKELSACYDRLRQADGMGTASGNNQDLQHQQQDEHAWGQQDAVQGDDALLQQQGQHKADAEQQVAAQQGADGGGMEWDGVSELQRDEDSDALTPADQHEQQSQEELRDQGKADAQEGGIAQEVGTAGGEVQVVPGVQDGGWLWSPGDEQTALGAALACERAGGGDGRHVQLLYDMQQVLWAELKKAVACNIRQREQLQQLHRV